MLKKIMGAMGLRTRAPMPAADGRVKPAPQPKTVDVTDADFATRVLEAEKPAVVDFWADWCEPCRTMSAFVEFLADDYGDKLTVAALDVEENPLIPDRYNIRGLPTLIFFVDGEEVDRQVGIAPYDELRQKVDLLLANEIA